MGSDFWDPLDVVVFTTWVVGLSASRFGDSSIGDTCGTISPSFFSVQSKPLDFACSFGLRTPRSPLPPKLGVILYPNFFGGLFLRRSKVKGRSWGNTAAQYSPFESGPSGPDSAWAAGPESLRSFL